MKFFRYLIVLLLLPLLAHSQAGEWVWMKGDSTTNSVGSFGIMGIPSPSNNPPAMYAPGFWTDTDGNLWVYGGVLDSGYIASALWRFDPNTLEWTWMNGAPIADSAVFAAASGVFNTANQPAPLGWGMNTWTDKHNHLWLYDGPGLYGAANNLWQYDPSINQWAWMTGSRRSGQYGAIYGNKGVASNSSTPGNRGESNCAWIDSLGNLWLFGGTSITGDFYNDMWKYDIESNQWAWMSGTTNRFDTGSYGPLDTPSVNYCPSVRWCNLYWQSSDGNFWLAGGTNYLGYGTNYFTDIWKFNPVTLEWTLVKGSAYTDTTNIASQNCRANTNNQQGGRYENRAVWKICDNMLLNYGGFHSDLGNYLITDNDLWAYYPQQNEWLRVNESSNAGSYGLQGMSSPLNYPPGRVGSAAFKDKRNNLWLFGGASFEFGGGRYNDLWKFVLDKNCVGSTCPQINCLFASSITTTANTLCPGDSAQICAPQNFTAYNWNNSSTGNCIEATGAGNYYVTLTDNSGCTAESNSIGIVVLQSPPISISRSGDTLRVYNANNIQWYVNSNPISGAIQNIYIAQAFGSYTVSVTDSNGCTTFSSPVDYTGVADISADDNVSIYPNPLSVGKWALAVGPALCGSAQVEILDAEGRVVYKAEIKTIHSEIEAPFAEGVYLLRIVSGAGIVARKLVKL